MRKEPGTGGGRGSGVDLSGFSLGPRLRTNSCTRQTLGSFTKQTLKILKCGENIHIVVLVGNQDPFIH